MRQLFDIADNVFACDIPAQGKGRLGLVLGEIPGLDDVPDEHGGNVFVGHFNAHYRDLIGNGGNADAGGAQRQGDIVRQIRDLAELHALVQHELIPGDGGPVYYIAGGGIYTKAGEGLCQAAGVVPQLGSGLDMILSPAGPQQGNGRELVDILPSRQLLLDFCRHGGGLSCHLFCGVGLLLSGRHRLLRQGNRLGNRSGCRCSDRHRRRDYRLLPLGNRRGLYGLLRQYLIRGLLLVGLVPEKAGKPSLLLRGFFRRLPGRLVVQGEVDLGLGFLLRPALGRLHGDHTDMGLLRLLLVLGPLPVLLNKGAHCQPQRRHQQHHEQHGEDDNGGQA